MRGSRQLGNLTLLLLGLGWFTADAVQSAWSLHEREPEAFGHEFFSACDAEGFAPSLGGCSGLAEAALAPCRRARPAGEGTPVTLYVDHSGSLDPAKVGHLIPLPTGGSAADARSSAAAAKAAPPRAAQGREEEALAALQRALATWRRLGDRSREAQVLNNLGGVYMALGENSRAIELYQQALAISRAAGSARTEAVALSNLGAALPAFDAPEAAQVLSQALALHRQAGDVRGEVRSLIGLGRIEAAGAALEPALKSFERAFSLAVTIDDLEAQSQAVYGIASLELQRGSYKRALDFYGRAQELSDRLGDRRGAAAALLGAARSERSAGRLEEAAKHIQKAIGIVEALRTGLASPELRASFLASQREIYGFYIDLLMQLAQQQPGGDYAGTAFRVSESVRARSLLDALGESRDEIRQGLSPELRARENQLKSQLWERERQRLLLLRQPGREQELAQAERELAGLLESYQLLQAEIRAQSPHYASLTEPQPLSPREVQEQLLDRGTLLLEYSLGEERSFLWALSPDSVATFVLPPRDRIEAAARRFYDTLRSSRQRVARSSAEAAARSLGEMLLGPVADRLGDQRLLIVADGALQYVPFAALSTGDGEPLVARHEIVMLPSASILAALRREMQGRPTAPETLAVVADPVLSADDPRLLARGSGAAGTSPQVPAGAEPAAAADRQTSAAELASLARLPYSGKEARTLLALVPPQQSFAATGFAASRETVTSGELGRYRFVHFATHALVDSDHPELSGIVLSLFGPTGQPQDGLLPAYELYNLSLHAELVVLSACQTGLGQEVRGEGLGALTRGFLYAGTPRVVASLWSVDDRATAELMAHFYRSLLVEKRSPAAALRQAQVRMQMDPRWSAPEYWAGFFLQGEWR